MWFSNFDVLLNEIIRKIILVWTCYSIVTARVLQTYLIPITDIVSRLVSWNARIMWTLATEKLLKT